jgi:hypothetical protein
MPRLLRKDLGKYFLDGRKSRYARENLPRKTLELRVCGVDGDASCCYLVEMSAVPIYSRWRRAAAAGPAALVVPQATAESRTAAAAQPTAKAGLVM